MMAFNKTLLVMDLYVFPNMNFKITTNIIATRSKNYTKFNFNRKKYITVLIHFIPEILDDPTSHKKFI